MGLGVLVGKDYHVAQAGGFIIQLMPFADDKVIDQLEENLKSVDSVTKLLSEGLTPEQLLERVLAGFDVEFTDKIPMSFYCDCDKKRVEKVLISVGKKELQNMIDEGKPIEVNCHFCNTNYTFEVNELKEIYKKSKA